MKFRLLPFFFFTLISCHKLTLNEYTKERCSYVDESIKLQTHSSHDDITIKYLIFHYKDILVSNIPSFKQHDYETPKQCGDDGCGGGYGYDIHFESDDHDEVFNSVLTKEKSSVKYDVKTPGFYCIYIDSKYDYSGVVEFVNSFGNLDIDNRTRLVFKSIFYLPVLTGLLIFVFLRGYHKRFRWFIGLIWLIQLFETLSLSFVSTFGFNVWTGLIDFLFANTACNLILGFILLWIMYHSVGYMIVEDESMIYKNTKIMLLIVGAFTSLKVLNDLFFNFSLIPYYDLHFNSIRRYLLLLQYIPYILIYVCVVFESLSLQKDFEITDPRVIPSFKLFAIIPIIVVPFKLILGAFIVHKSDPVFYDNYFKDVSVLILNFLTDVVFIFGLLYLCSIWKPRRYQKVASSIDQAIELADQTAV